jgi:hypothetical protein
MRTVNVGIIGVGNCASSLVQGVAYYANMGSGSAGLTHAVCAGYAVSDVRFTAAFDVNTSKIDLDLAEAIWAAPNNALKFADVPHLGVKGRDSSVCRVVIGSMAKPSRHVRRGHQGLGRATPPLQAPVQCPTRTMGADDRLGRHAAGLRGTVPRTETPRLGAQAAPSPALAADGATRHPLAASTPHDASVSRATPARHDARQAPGAVVPHAGSCAGGAG